MKKLKLVPPANLLFIVALFVACRENIKDDDPTSTITPGNNLVADSATAHANNTDSITQLKNARKENAINNDDAK